MVAQLEELWFATSHIYDYMPFWMKKEIQLLNTSSQEDD